jgi:NodT family efflux transporter outer membrane factor (OMF) lipoprotein
MGSSKQFGRALKSLSLMLLLTGCTVGPDFRMPDAPSIASYLPAGFFVDQISGEKVDGQKIVRGADIPARWWELFHSRSLTRLIEDGIANNPDLEAAEAALRIAQANALAQRSDLFPTVLANFNPTRQRVPNQSVTSNAATGANIYSLHTAQVSVNFVPDVFGGTRRQIESLDAQVDAQAFQWEGVFLTLSSNIALAAIEEASLRGQIAAINRIIGIQDDLQKILKAQNDKGQIALPDVVSQETIVAQARLLLPPLERALGEQRNLLATLTGRFPGEAGSTAFQLSSFRMPRSLPLSLPADLVRQRPDVRVAEAAMQAANAQIGVALANRLPQIVLTADAGSSALALSKLFSPGTGFWMVAGNAAQTIFDAGRLEAKQRSAEAAYDQAAAQYRSVVLTAFRNVADVLRALQTDARAIDAAIAAERSASRNIDLIRKQVEQGQVSVPILITAQQAYLQTSVARVQAEAARLADSVALFQALGGGWWNKPATVATRENIVR